MISPGKPSGLNNLHARFQQQAEWTASLRAYLLAKLQAEQAAGIIEIGCGTGALTNPLHHHTPTQVFGIDIDLPRLVFARQADPQSVFACADGLHLPFASHSFGLAVCHFLLLWVSDPLRVLAEMRRVTRSGGWVLALAEPDYGGRVEYPAELARLGDLQTQALHIQGADPYIGRRLPAMFIQTGLKEVHSGVLGGEWGHPSATTAPDETALEWDVLTQDLQGMVSPAELERCRAIETTARQKGERLLFVPTFYAFGRV